MFVVPKGVEHRPLAEPLQSFSRHSRMTAMTRSRVLHLLLVIALALPTVGAAVPAACPPAAHCPMMGAMGPAAARDCTPAPGMTAADCCKTGRVPAGTPADTGRGREAAPVQAVAIDPGAAAPATAAPRCRPQPARTHPIAVTTPLSTLLATLLN
jgi:hypothetical protein